MSTKPIRVLTVDDHSLLRDGIAKLLGAQPDMELVAEASNGREAIEQFRTQLGAAIDSVEFVKRALDRQVIATDRGKDPV